MDVIETKPVPETKRWVWKEEASRFQELDQKTKYMLVGGIALAGIGAVALLSYLLHDNK